jgi:hypothetical protein
MLQVVLGASPRLAEPAVAGRGEAGPVSPRPTPRATLTPALSRGAAEGVEPGPARPLPHRCR